MDNFKYDFNKEYEDIVEEVSQKFGYKEELSSTLVKIAKAVLDGKSFEDRQIFYKMLRTTPIVIIPDNSKISHEEIVEKMLGDVNPHIKDKSKVDLGEYGKQKAAGAFVSEPIIDENLNIKGIKKFLYITEINTSRELSESQKKYIDMFHTVINVPHLIHELGHAWASEENPYSIEDGILTQRMGTVETKFKLTDLENGQYESEAISTTGLFIEEGINTNFEERSIAKYLGISLEAAKKLYKNNTITPSIYQASISTMTESLYNGAFMDDIEKWRMYGDKNAEERLNEKFLKTNFYEKRDKLFLRSKGLTGDPESNLIAARNMIFDNPEMGENEANLMERLEKDFFPDATESSPMEVMDMILKQFYDVNANKYSIQIENYGKILNVIAREGYGLINQATKIQEEKREFKEESK